MIAMFTTIIAMQSTIQWRTLLLWRGVLALLIALLASGFVGMGTGVAYASSAQLLPPLVSSQEADAAPAIGLMGLGAYIGWTGTNAAHNLNLMTYDAENRSFGPALVLPETTPAGSGPSLAAWNNNLYVAWRGKDNRLNVGRFNPTNPTHLTNKVTLNEYSNDAPSIGGQSTHLYLGWRGTDGHLNIISSIDGSHFSAKATYPYTIRTSPTLNGTPFGLFVAWEDTSASSHIVMGSYALGLPARVVITTTSISQLPVSLDSYSGQMVNVVVAWRTANDAHVRMGTFANGSVLQNPTVTTYTTAYCPALFPALPVMIWTGTDAAHHINAIWL
jgi:hypothetical protein